MRDAVDTGAKYVIALVVVIGCLILVYQGRGDQTQPWTIMGLVIGWIIRDSAGASATRNATDIAASQPTVTTTAGPPQRTTVTPSEGPA